jgi:hypothetical protein
MRFVKKDIYNVLFIAFVFISIILSFKTFNNRMNAYINGEPPPKRLIQRTLDTYFEK